MKIGYFIITLSLVTGLLTSFSVAFAHGTEKHDKMLADPQMKKLHAMMPMFSLASAGLEAALEKGEVKDAEVEAKKIIAAISDLKASKPHKNVNQRKKYVELASNLELAITSTLDLAKRGNFTGARVAFRKIEETCATCHAKFRD